MSEPRPAIGRVVHVCIGTEGGQLVLRPATIVRVWSETCINVQVQLDGANDRRHIGDVPSLDEAACERGLCWMTSVMNGNGVGEWRWPARS